MTDSLHGTPADGNRLRLDHQLCFPLYAATNLVQRHYRPLLAQIGLTYSQYLVMLVLWERGTVHVGALRDCLHLDTGTVTPLLKRMEAAGLLTRTRDAGDERRVLVALTGHGDALRVPAAAIPARLAAQVGLPLDDLAQLHTLTTRLVDTLHHGLSDAETPA